MLDLINDILDMSRIESGKASVEEKPCDLVEAAEHLGSIVQSEVGEKGLRYEVDLSGLHHPIVMCDELKLKQVLLNILGNAVKFTPSGGSVSFSISEAAADADGKANYTMTIADSGIGMDEAFIKHIFDPFERERTSTLSGTQGTGLGMSIAKRLVDMMGGDISVTSVKGEGSTFSVTLPLETLDEGAVPAQGDAGARSFPSSCMVCASCSWMTISSTARSPPRCWRMRGSWSSRRSMAGMRSITFPMRRPDTTSSSSWTSRCRS